MINYEKSALTFNLGAPEASIEAVQKEFGVQVAASHSVYLGLPTFVMKNRRLQFDYLAERAASRVGYWVNKNFSVGGKEVLIKSVIQAIPTYTMACFRIPMTVCNNIERVCARFWWGDKEKEKHMHWMNWKLMCRPKSSGGMGFRSLVEFNQALLAKQVWRLVRFPDSLVSRLLKAKYFPSSDVMHAKIASNCSFSWRSLMWGRELLEKGLMWKIGDGESVRVFEDAWIPSLHNGKTIRRPTGQQEVRVAEFIDEHGEWISKKLEEQLLPVEVEEILKLDRSELPARDSRYWRFDQHGVYTVRSGYLVATGYFDTPGRSSEDEQRRWWRFLWSFDVPPRIRVFAWRCFRDIIPTEMNLSRHHVPIFGRCGWCRRGWGTTAHALIYCDKIRHFWSLFDCWEVLKRWEGFSMVEVGEAMRSSQTRHEFELWIVGLWLMWKALCAQKHDGKSWPWNDLRRECESYLEAYTAAGYQAALVHKILPNEGDKQWKKPKRGHLRLDVDYAVDEAKGVGGVGAIVHDCTGQILMAMAKPLARAVTTLHGELKALVHGIRQCVEEELAPLEVYTDSMLAVVAIAEEVEEESVLPEDFFDFFATVKKLNVISISHVGREANKAAHEIARYARSLDTTLVWHDTWPSWLLNVLADDNG